MNKTKKVDKRSLRTRALIKKSVMILLKKKRPEEIAVTEVTKIALISRNSFYPHYKSVQDVLKDIFSDVLDMFDLVLSKYEYSEFEKDPFPCLKEISMPLIANSAFSEFVIFSKTSNSFAQGIIDSLTDKFYNKYLEHKGFAKDSIPYLVNFIVSGSINFVYKWFKDGKTVPFDQVLKDISILITNGIVMIKNIKNTL